MWLRALCTVYVNGQALPYPPGAVFDAAAAGLDEAECARLLALEAVAAVDEEESATHGPREETGAAPPAATPRRARTG